MRVVVDGNLIVEAGASFRDGTGEGNYDPRPSDEKFYGTGGGELFDGDTALADLTPEDLPAAWADEGQNDSLSVQTAVKNLSGTYNFPDFLQVRNEGTEAADVGIRFNEYGEDVNDGPVESADLIQAYEFFSGGSESDGRKISTHGNPNASDINNQSLPNTVTVDTGDIEQIGLTIDLTEDSIRSAIASAAAPEDENVFGEGDYDTVHLVESLRVGSENTSN
jgi:hypothetical protein